jgi:phosphatidate cytidylyltransferase
MFKLRILTAIILIPLFTLLLLKLSPSGFMYFTSCFVLLGAWEWSSLMGLEKVPYRLCYSAAMYGFLTFPLFAPTQIVLLLAVIGWLIAFILVWLYPKGTKVWGKGIYLRGLMGLFVLVPTWRALNFLRDTDLFGLGNGPYVLLYLFVLIWGADSGAYFSGKLWGRNKLAPHVSPGKTLQGLMGALGITILLAPLLLLLPVAIPLWEIILLALLTVLFSVGGDLFESMLKRNVNLKDSGRLFPGHGGLLDRIDSLTAAAPLFALGVIFLLQL